MDRMLKSLEMGSTAEYKQWEITRVPCGWIFRHMHSGHLVFVAMPGI